MFITQIIIAQTIEKESSYVQFLVGNMGGIRTVKGQIEGLEGDLVWSQNTGELTSIDVCIHANTLNTNNKTRDKHLKGEDFFDVEEYPSICFQSTSIGFFNGELVAKGILTMHGVSKEVVIPLSVTSSIIEGKLNLKRLDFNIGPSGGFMVGKDVEVNIYCKIKTEGDE